MRIVYTAKPIEGIVEDGPRPVTSRIAKETLKAVIEEYLIRQKYVTSYTITDNKHFNFPFEMPNMLHVRDFFQMGDYNTIAKEINELFEQPKREYAEFEAKLKADLETATNEQMLALVEKFHWTPKGTKQRYFEAKEKIRGLWKPIEQCSGDLFSTDYSHYRAELSQYLGIVNDCHVQSLVDRMNKVDNLLCLGQRDKAIEEIDSLYRDWRRKNLAPLENCCGDSSFYGAGFWLARLVCPDGEVKVENYGYTAPKTAEEALKAMKMPYQAVLL